MLINSDFERHGFVLTHNFGKAKKYSNPHIILAGHELSIIQLSATKVRKGFHKVELLVNDIMLCYEVMSSPEELRLFLLHHKII
jgi:hypothetical protein